MARATKQDIRERRKRGTRGRIAGSAQRPRLTVFRSNKHIYAQVVDDDSATSLVAASTLSKELSEQLKGKSKLEKAKLVGAMVAKGCQEKGISRVVFDRNGYLYHGRIRGVAEGAREAGLDF